MKDEPVFVVAEIGMNHMGDEMYANTYIDALVDAKPDGVTFQVREHTYEKQQPGGPLYLSDAYYTQAATRLKEGGVQFGVGLCALDKLSFFEELGTDFYKILSKDITNTELVSAILATGKPTFVSTGMSDEEEIGTFLQTTSRPGPLSLIHTQLSYEDADTNLSAIGKLKERFGVPVAFGSHSTDINALYVALGFRPSALFMYVKGDRSTPHGDEAHAVPLGQVASVVTEVRRLECMLGDGIKRKMENRIKDQQEKKI